MCWERILEGRCWFWSIMLRLVLQGTSVVAGDNHLVHFYGYNFYVVGWIFGNFDPKKDPHKYNLVDPPQETTVGVPKNGWVALRLRAIKFCISGVSIRCGHRMLNNALKCGYQLLFLEMQGKGGSSCSFQPSGACGK
ncbi:hypothetical protein PIB30_019931 [Stylosanthes scabra]|uniref:Plastocyanin-like domain-containing protein n=1 Tax=Stylosanthes scabra TaxID=79078 RepID=A0ABU6WC00_9FABA|nr:hypothetical protein [Stylosanthes scabra]